MPVIPYAALNTRIREELARISEVGAGTFVFGQQSSAITALLVFIGLGVALLVIRTALRSRSTRDRIGLPALLSHTRGSRLGAIRHLALMVLLAGLPLFVLALAEPYITLAEEQLAYPGRRIALLIDASSSMLAPFPAERLGAKAPNEATFFTTVAAADAFIRQRQNGQYRDLISLIEFGDEAYVITPFTTDYDNVLLSAALISDWGEFMHFPNQGTTIAAAIERATDLFRAFDFADASGNLMVIFSDGQDTQLSVGETPVSQILAAAIATKIPVYLVRTSRGKALGEVVPDSIWKPAVEVPGGRFYPAANESDVLRAIADIDTRSPGTIQVKHYSTNQPRFAPFALGAAVLWAVGLLLQLTVPYLRTFP